MIELFRLVQLYDFAAARDEIQWIRMEVRLLGDANSNVPYFVDCFLEFLCFVP